ncbi:MAG TPA: MlaD family protein [Actinomycetota bacterium]|nr:MlaD family protein [Actinomycetota bacterium]
MRIDRRLIINTTAFLVLSGLLILLLAVQVLPTVFGSTYHIYGIFPTAGGVATNQEVSYRGVQIGRVGRMSLTSDAVKIEMIINSKWKIPKDGTRAQIQFKSAVGEQFIDLLPTSPEGPVFSNGDVIPESLTETPLQIEDLLKEFSVVLNSIDPKQLGIVIHELGTGLGGHGEDLRAIIKMLDQLATIGADRQTEIAALLKNGADLQDAFNSNSAEFQKGIAALNQVLATAAAHTNDLNTFFSTTQTLDTDLLDLLTNRKPQIDTVVSDLATVTRLAHRHLQSLNLLLTYLGPFFADVSAAYQAPYFIFNMVENPTPLQCSYDPSSRPVRAVTDASPKEPATNFRCAGTAASTSTATPPPIVPMTPTAQLELERVSWLHLYTLGY